MPVWRVGWMEESTCQKGSYIPQSRVAPEDLPASCAGVVSTDSKTP